MDNNRRTAIATTGLAVLLVAAVVAWYFARSDGNVDKAVFDAANQIANDAKEADAANPTPSPPGGKSEMRMGKRRGNQ
jgi:hypothetical protein